MAGDAQLMLGSIAFGPIISQMDRHADVVRRLVHSQTVTKDEISWSCNCVGPQQGQKLCPCALRAESAKGAAMIRDGVTIDGVEYELVRKA